MPVATETHHRRIAEMIRLRHPCYVTKVEKKGRTLAELGPHR